MAATVRGERRGADVGDGPFDLASSDARRSRSRLPEILVGTLLVASFALAGAWFYSTSLERTSYLAIGQPIARGEVVERADLFSLELSSSSTIQALEIGQLEQIVGKVALVDLAVGTIATPEQFSEAALIPAGWGVVGLDLDASRLPSLALRPGDLVRVVAVGSPAGPAGDDPLVLAEEAEIVEVVEGGGSGRFVAITVEAETADRVAAAASEGSVHLIQVAGG